MRVVDLPMSQADVQNAVLPESNLAMVATMVFASANHARCIPRRVQAVGTRRRFLSSHETTGPSTVAIAFSLRAPQIEVIVVSRVGRHHE